MKNINEDVIFLFLIFITVWLTVGDPDLIYAMVHYLMKND